MKRCNCLVPLFALFGMSSGHADDSSLKSDTGQQGLQIAQEVDRRDTGWGDSEATLTMTIRCAKGQASTRKMGKRSPEVGEDGDKSLLIFDHPKDVRGTALLTFAHRFRSDDQWLYLPTLKRAKRIACNNKSGPSMGSEVTYEDMSSEEVKMYTYRYLGEEVLDGADCFKVERDPIDERSGYTRQIVWIDQDEYRFRRIDYFDRRGSHLKTLTYQDYERHLGK